METKPQGSPDSATAWRIVLRALWSRPALASGSVVLLALATLLAAHLYELVLGMSWRSWLAEWAPTSARLAQRGLTLLAACAVCALAGSLGARIMSQPRHPLLLSAAAWFAVLCAPYMIGLPARAMIATAILEAQALSLLSAIVCFAVLKAVLAAALLHRLARSGAATRPAANDIVALFGLFLPLFVGLMALQVVADLALWDGDQPVWEVVYGVTVLGDALAALLATMLAFALRARDGSKKERPAEGDQPVSQG